MSVVIAVEDSGPSRKELKIEVPAPAVEAELRRVIDEFGRSVQVPGFRKGKVPKRLVQQRFKQEIENELLDRLLPRYWKQAEAEVELDALLQPELENYELKDGEPLVFTVGIDVRPQVTLGDLDSFQLPEPAGDPTDEEVQDALDDLRRSFGAWVEVERPAAQGDMVTAEMTRLASATDADAQDADSGDADSEERTDTVNVEIGGQNVWEELSVALTHLSAGQQAEFSRSQGEGEDARELKFRVVAQKVQERELPELDDAFAEKVGKFESVDALKEAVTGSVANAKRDARRREREVALLDQLREAHPLELPKRVVEGEIRSMLEDYAQHMAQQGVKPDDVDWDRLGEAMRPQAEKRVHAQLLLDAVAKERELRVDEQEFEAHLSAIARQRNSSTMAIRQALDSSGRLQVLRTQLTREKVIRALLGEPDPFAGAEAELAGPGAEPEEAELEDTGSEEAAAEHAVTEESDAQA